MMKPGKKGISRIIDATFYSIKGLKAAWKNEAAFRQEVIVAIILTPLAFVVGKTVAEVSILLISLALILIAELANSALEAVVDRFGGEIHELSGRAKDIGSAMVMIALFFTSIVWIYAMYHNVIK